MGAVITSIIFLFAGGAVYAFNTESHEAKITFNRFGLEIGETETAAILLGLGVFFLGLGAVRWMMHQGALDDDEGDDT